MKLPRIGAASLHSDHTLMGVRSVHSAEVDGPAAVRATLEGSGVGRVKLIAAS